MTDGADHRHRTRRDRSNRRLLVEAPQVLHRPAAPAQEDRVELPIRTAGAPVRETLESRPHFAGGAFALHAAVAHDDLDPGGSAPEDGDDVVKRRALARRDDAHAAWERRQRPFALRIQHALRRELPAEPLEGDPPQPLARRLDGAYAQLEPALPRVDGRTAVDEDLHAVLRIRRQTPCIPAEEDARDAGIALLVPEGEVAVPDGGAGPVRHFAADPEVAEPLLQRAARGFVQVGHGDRALRGAAIADLRRAEQRGLTGHVQPDAATVPAAARRAVRSADRTVFRRSMAIVMGPTPPGTGVIQLARSTASSNATSPTSR